MVDAKDIATVSPGAAAMVASWLGIIESGLSIALLIASLCFLGWRWQKAILESKLKSKSATPVIDKKKRRKSK